MKRIKNFRGFVNESLLSQKNYEKEINENVQAAKAYMLNKFSKRKGGQITKEEEIQILSNKDYQEIKNNIVGDNPGWVNAFVRFHFEQGVSLEDLKSLKADLLRYKPLLGNLPMTIDQYAKIQNISKEEKIKKLSLDLKRAEESGDENWINDIKNQAEQVNAEEITDTRPGIERLQDELRYIEKEREAKWLIDGLPARAASSIGKTINLRDAYRNADPEIKNQIINIGSTINSADSSEEIKKRFLKKISGFDSIERLVEFGGSFIKSIGSNIDKLSQQAESLYPGVAIMYEDDQYIALSLRSEPAQKALCSAANWCINRGSFWSYAAGNVQLNVFNFGLPQTDRYFLIGMTVNEDGTVRNSHDVNDSSIMKSGEKYYQQLERMGYPQKLIDEIKKYFALEFEVKKLTDTFYKGGSGIHETIDKFLKYSYKFVNDPAFDRVKSIFFEIINQDINLSVKGEIEKIKNVFVRPGDLTKLQDKGAGLMNSVAIEIFDSIFPNPETEFMQRVAEVTMLKFQSIEVFAKRMNIDASWNENFAKSNPNLYDNINVMIEGKDEIMKKISPYL